DPRRYLNRSRLRRIPLTVQRALGHLSRDFCSLREALQDRCTHAGRTGCADQESRNFQQGLRHDRTPGCGRTRHAVALPFSRRPAAEPRRVREAGARQDTPQLELRASPLSLQLLQPYLGKRIQRRLLRLSVDGDARGRWLPVVRRTRRTYPRQRRSFSPDGPLSGISRGPRQNVRELARRTTQCEGDAEAPGAGGIHSGQIATTERGRVRAIQRAGCDLSARKLSWHFLAAESNSANSGVPRSFAHAESFCKPAWAQKGPAIELLSSCTAASFCPQKSMSAATM